MPHLCISLELELFKLLCPNVGRINALMFFLWDLVEHDAFSAWDLSPETTNTPFLWPVEFTATPDSIRSSGL